MSSWPNSNPFPPQPGIQSLQYQLIIQGVNLNLIPVSVVSDVTVPIAAGLASGPVPVQLDPGTVDQQFSLMRSDFVDFLCIMPSGLITFKLNTTADIPKTIRGGGIVLLDGQNFASLYLSNPGAVAITVAVVQGRVQAVS